MLAKLMKYDIKKMSKILVIIYVISLALASVTRLVNIGKNIQVIFIIGVVFSSLVYSAIGSIIVNTFVYVIRIFTIDFFKDESYLTHTLPIKKSKLLLSKYLSSLIVILCSIIVCFLSLFIMFYSPSFMEGLNVFISATIAGFNMPSWLFITLIVLIVFAQICAMVSMAFAAIIKANTYNHKRIFKGLLWFALFYFCTMITTIISSVIVFAIQGNISQLLATQMNNIAFVSILLIGFIVYLACAVLFYFISYKLFKKGVNVD